MRARSERRGGRQRESSFRSRGEENFHSEKEALMPMSNMVTALTGGYSPLEMGEKNGDGYLAIEDVIGCEAKVRSKQELFAEASH
ncbi:uncharacterized protein DS421_18g627770 [Arachis hypogaea]|nr:uncharacterized protein DS421_18g627770 [Arachis hypogaea]